jgi:hypothetical protein
MSHSDLAAPWSERRRWRAIMRRLERTFESDLLATLRTLAAGNAPVHAIGPAGLCGYLAGPVQLTAGDRRLALGRVQADTWATLSTAIAVGPVNLAGAGRYGRGWVLTFRGPHAAVTLLADHIRLLPAEGGAARDCGAPLELLAS